MARPDAGRRFRPSLLDRLIADPGPPAARAAPPAPARDRLTTAELKDALRRDLEDLFNTRFRPVSPPEGCAPLARSILDFGIPDPATAYLSSEEQIDAFRAAMQRAVETLDRRFRSVEITTLERGDEADHTLRFRIRAVVARHEDEEPLVFHSYMEPSTCRFSVVSRQR